MSECDECKTEPGGLLPSEPPGKLTSEQMTWEILCCVRELRSAQRLSDEELRCLRLRLDELVLDVIPRLERLEAKLEQLEPRVKVAEFPCENCPLREAV